MILKSLGRRPKSFITAAALRRDVVINLTAEQKERGHPMSKKLDMTVVRDKAIREYPRQGPLPGHAHQTAHDNSLDRILMQKCASPSLVASS